MYTVIKKTNINKIKQIKNQKSTKPINISRKKKWKIEFVLFGFDLQFFNLNFLFVQDQYFFFKKFDLLYAFNLGYIVDTFNYCFLFRGSHCGK